MQAVSRILFVFWYYRNIIPYFCITYLPESLDFLSRTWP